MRPLRIFYSDHFEIPLPEDHRFPIRKYRLLRDRLLQTGLLGPSELFEAPLASREVVLRAHDPGYVGRFLDGGLTDSEIRRLGFPWSGHLVKKVLASVGGALAAAEEALQSGISGNLAGGTHHAHRDFGSGYCAFNDQACVALELLGRGAVRRVAIVDLDVHQGDGTAAILGDREDVFLLNVYCEKNFPFRKMSSHLDLALPEGASDHEFLEKLEPGLEQVWAFGPDLVLYQAGVDPLAEDSLGKLALTHRGLYQRDLRVLSECRRRGIPVSLALGGGYSRPIEPTLEAYVGTYRAVREVFG